MLNLTDRLKKLRAMSVAEVAQRLRYQVAINRERNAHARGTLAPAGRLRDNLTPDMKTGNWQDRLLASRSAATTFFPSVYQQSEMKTLFNGRFRRELESARVKAADATAHRFRFFGSEFNYGEVIPWQTDPVTVKAWPAIYHGDVPVHGGDAGYGDVKYVWELNRQQYLIDLAKVFFLDRDPIHLEAIERLVRSWMSGNPYATGVNWSCALEPAFRAISWMWAYELTSPDIGREFHLEWLTGVLDHARFIEAHLEYYSSPFNHLIGEAAALYMIGVCFPEFRDAPRWRMNARAVLEGRLGEQFYADGGSTEQSTFYHHATTGFYVLAALTARRVNDDLSPAVWAAIERAVEFSMKLSQPDGRTPEIGGADDGKPIRMEHLPFWDFRPYLSLGAVIFGRPDFKAVAGHLHEDALWLMGPGACSTYDDLEEAEPAERSSALPQSGYYVLRSDWGHAADYVCFDCGEQAAGMRPDGVPNSMHGHADCLSMILWLKGQRILIDSGFFSYNCGGEWEAHFRETAAHNTARVDRRDQANHIGKMAWSHSYRARLEHWMSHGQHGWVVGSHDGYARSANGVTHRRAVWLRSEHYLIICDEFTGSGAHDFEVNFQFAPGELIAAGPQRVIFDDTAELCWVGTGTWVPHLASGGSGPDEGWVAPSLGVRQPAPRLSLRCSSGDRHTTLLTVLASYPKGDPRVAVVSEQAGAGPQSLMIVDCGESRDWVVSRGLPQHVISTDAIVAVCRTQGAAIVDTIGIEAGHLTVDSIEVGRLMGRPS